MGSRAVFGFAKSAGTEPIFLYGHWCGEERYELLVKAVDAARPRWNDHSYATRICISQIIGEDWAGQLNWGISAGHNSFAWPDFHEVPIVVWDEACVHITDASDTTKTLAYIELEDLSVDLLAEVFRVAPRLARS